MNDIADWLPQIDTTLCTGCADCVIHCPTDALEIIDDRAVLTRANLCIYCADCELICPTSAIEVPYLVVTKRPKE